MSEYSRQPLVRNSFVQLLCCAAVLGLASCAHHRKPEPPPPLAAKEKPKPKPLYEWNAEAAASAKGPISIRIIVDEQKAHVYKGKTEIGWTTVASGIHKYPTPVGEFKILERVEDKHSNLYGKIYDKDGKVTCSDARVGRDEIPEGGHFEGAQMHYWMRVTSDGVGMHVGPIPHPGSRASHGCIRLPREAARHLFETVSIGTPVSIIGKYEPPPKFDKPKTKPAVKKADAVDTPPTTPAVVEPTTPRSEAVPDLKPATPPVVPQQ